MAEDPTPLDQAPPLDAEEPPYLKIPAELGQIVIGHQEWLNTNKKRGAQAQIDGYDFAYLDLTNVNLPQALLKESDFKGANLTGATFRGAELRGARFFQADLLKVNFRDADLTDADLSGAKNLTASQLGGANLTNAKLPEVLGKFEDLSNIAEASKNAAHVFITMLAACVLSWLTVASTTDVGLITNTPTSTLPVIGTVLPIVGFYVAAPILLLAVYVYFHITLARLWEGLTALPAVFPDGRRLDQVAYPWLLNGLVCLYFYRLRDKNKRPPFAWSQFFLALMLAWGLVPLTISLLYLRYLTRQDWPVTLENIVLLALAAGFGLRSFLLARRILSGRECWSPRTDIGCVAASILLFMIVLIFAFGSIFAFPESIDEDLRKGEREKIPRIWVTAGCSSRGTELKIAQEFRIQLPGSLKFLHLFPYEIHATGLRRAIPKVFQSLPLPFGPFANLAEAEVSTKPANWTNEEKALELVRAAPLKGRNLRYADGYRAFLVRADLRQADLTRAFLYKADLRRAQLEFAKLRGADLQGADLQGANFRKAGLVDAKLQGANLQQANLQQANLVGADLEGAKLQRAELKWARLGDASLHSAELHNADLLGAKLQHADLGGANLTEAKLQGADLEGANLTEASLQQAKLCGVRGVSEDQVKAANCWPLAFYDPSILKMLGFPKDHNNRLKPKGLQDQWDLTNYNLQGADLRGAKLQGAKLQGANLQGANLRNVELYNTDLRGANLQDANLEEAIMYRADLHGANLKNANLHKAKDLTREQLKSAVMDEHTQLPDDLKDLVPSVLKKP